jgi:hypothetical protein
MGRQRNFSRGHRSYLSLSLSLSRETLRESEVRHRVLWGNRFFFSCTRHVSMHLRRGIVIHSFIHSFCPRVVNPCSGLGGLEGQQKMSVILSVRPSVCLSVPGSLARVASPQSSVPSPFLFPPELSWCPRSLLKKGKIISSVYPLSHGVLFFISVLGHYPRFTHPCYRNVLSR